MTDHCPECSANNEEAKSSLQDLRRPDAYVALVGQSMTTYTAIETFSEYPALAAATVLYIGRRALHPPLRARFIGGLDRAVRPDLPVVTSLYANTMGQHQAVAHEWVKDSGGHLSYDKFSSVARLWGGETTGREALRLVAAHLIFGDREGRLEGVLAYPTAAATRFANALHHTVSQQGEGSPHAGLPELTMAHMVASAMMPTPDEMRLLAESYYQP